MRLAVPVHGHEGIGMDLEDVAGRRLVPGGHAADGPGSEHAAARGVMNRSPREAAGTLRIGPTLNGP
mgnify:CR=1 FL=1